MISEREAATARIFQLRMKMDLYESALSIMGDERLKALQAVWRERRDAYLQALATEVSLDKIRTTQGQIQELNVLLEEPSVLKENLSQAAKEVVRLQDKLERLKRKEAG